MQESPSQGKNLSGEVGDPQHRHCRDVQQGHAKDHDPCHRFLFGIVAPHTPKRRYIQRLSTRLTALRITRASEERRLPRRQRRRPVVADRGHVLYLVDATGSDAPPEPNNPVTLLRGCCVVGDWAVTRPSGAAGTDRLSRTPRSATVARHPQQASARAARAPRWGAPLLPRLCPVNRTTQRSAGGARGPSSSSTSDEVRRWAPARL
jgi:hypothetical protein